MVILRKLYAKSLGMEYSVRPTRAELEKVKSIIENAVDSYSYSLDIENPEILLSWQRTEESFSVLEVKEKSIIVAVNPDADDLGDAHDRILTALIELEFMEKMEHPEISFKWQELLKFAYTALKRQEILGKEPEASEIVAENWEYIRDQLGQRMTEYDKFYYMNTLMIGESLSKCFEVENPEELIGFTKSDVEAAGEKL